MCVILACLFMMNLCMCVQVANVVCLYIHTHYAVQAGLLVASKGFFSMV